MAKAGRKTDLANVFDDLKKSITDSATESTSSVSGIPSIIDFIENKEWLGLPHRENPINLYPMQRIVLKSFYKNSIGNENLVLTKDEIEACKQHGLDDDDNGNLLGKMDSNETFRELILVWGRRSGKDFVISILACYEAAKLLEAPGGDPYRLYKLGTGAPFTIITIANSSDQAKILFDEIKDKIINSPYFKDKFYPEAILADQIRLLTPADKKKNEELEAKGLPKSLGSVIIKCGHSNSDSLAGISCYTLLFDEIGLYKQTSGSSGGESLYRTLVPATTTYIREVESIDENGKKIVKTVYDGKVICISSPRGKDGVFYELFRTTPQVKDRLACKLPTWIVNPKQKRDQLRAMFSQMTEEEFNMEFGAEFSGVSGQRCCR
jgi:hypothetical protein